MQKFYIFLKTLNNQFNMDGNFDFPTISYVNKVVSNIFIFTPTWGNDPIWLIFFKRFETNNQ